jgi:hypothetical protein
VRSVKGIPILRKMRCSITRNRIMMQPS